MPVALKKGTAIRPLADRVLVRPHKPDEKTKSGIFVPEPLRNQQGYLRWGTVLRVGPGKRTPDGTKHIPIDVRVGDVVLYSHHTAFEAGPDTDVEDLSFVYESDLIAVREKEPTD